jgi:hypothetical protein
LCSPVNGFKRDDPEKPKFTKINKAYISKYQVTVLESLCAGHLEH